MVHDPGLKPGVLLESVVEPSCVAVDCGHAVLSIPYFGI